MGVSADEDPALAAPCLFKKPYDMGLDVLFWSCRQLRKQRVFGRGLVVVGAGQAVYQAFLAMPRGDDHLL